ncbi:unnamed protein product [Moneuplotes crassus]|uniref:VTT domain-containing protein n=1 Tax=Euplotes crassus TaxID=5936 RepID=A0AAD1UKE3_EUPCR|nr:unnamed protein product [Moneuplotes crassus]
MSSRAPNSEIIIPREGEELEESSLERNNRVIISISPNNSVVRPQSDSDSGDADDRVDNILYGNPMCTLRKTMGLVLKILCAALMLGVTCVLMWIFNTNHPAAKSTVMFITMNGVAAPFILILINILITLFFLPGIFGALLCGFSYCFIISNVPLVLLAGTATCFIGFSIGSIMAMYIGRYLAKSCINKIHDKNKYLRALSLCFEKKGLKIMFLLRLSPLIPYNLLNYVMGVYPITIIQFSIANLGMVPGILIYVYIGTAVSSMGALFETNSGGSILKIVMFSIGLIFAVIAIIIIIAYTKKELNKALKDKEKEEKNKIRSDQESGLQDQNKSESRELRLGDQDAQVSPIIRSRDRDNSETLHGSIKRPSNDDFVQEKPSSQENFVKKNTDKFTSKIAITPNPSRGKMSVEKDEL